MFFFSLDLWCYHPRTGVYCLIPTGYETVFFHAHHMCYPDSLLAVNFSVWLMNMKFNHRAQKSGMDMTMQTWFIGVVSKIFLKLEFSETDFEQDLTAFWRAMIWRKLSLQGQIFLCSERNSEYVQTLNHLIPKWITLS